MLHFYSSANIFKVSKLPPPISIQICRLNYDVSVKKKIKIWPKNSSKNFRNIIIQQFLANIRSFVPFSLSLSLILALPLSPLTYFLLPKAEQVLLKVPTVAVQWRNWRRCSMDDGSQDMGCECEWLLFDVAGPMGCKFDFLGLIRLWIW